MKIGEEQGNEIPSPKSKPNKKSREIERRIESQLRVNSEGEVLASSRSLRKRQKVKRKRERRLEVTESDCTKERGKIECLRARWSLSGGGG